jgi:ABC-type dipeptide/oligopeptide/nickel transport system ATPase component
MTAQRTKHLLEVNNIEVIYNHVILVLKGVSLSVPKGGITALLGGNGAGKTTTLKAISQLLHSERGEVTKGTILPIAAIGLGLNPSDSGEARRHPGDGRPPLFRTSNNRRKSADRQLIPARMAGRGQCGSWRKFIIIFQG